jgi:antitoxin HicB
MSIRTKSVDDYLALPYTIEVIHDPSGEQAGWFARVVELPGCMTQTDHFDELEGMVQDAMRAWIVTAFEAGVSVPEPEVEGSYSGHLTVRVPRSLHRDLAVAAAQDGVSLSTFVAAALGRTLGASAPKTHAVREDAVDYTSPQ